LFSFLNQELQKKTSILNSLLHKASFQSENSLDSLSQVAEFLNQTFLDVIDKVKDISQLIFGEKNDQLFLNQIKNLLQYLKNDFPNLVQNTLQTFKFKDALQKSLDLNLIKKPISQSLDKLIPNYFQFT
jgi:transcriptional regulator of heat shock response